MDALLFRLQRQRRLGVGFDDRDLLERIRVLRRVFDLPAYGLQSRIHGRHLLAQRRLGFVLSLNRGRERESENQRRAEMPDAKGHVHAGIGDDAVARCDGW